MRNGARDAGFAYEHTRSIQLKYPFKSNTGKRSEDTCGSSTADFVNVGSAKVTGHIPGCQPLLSGTGRVNYWLSEFPKQTCIDIDIGPDRFNLLAF